MNAYHTSKLQFAQCISLRPVYTSLRASPWVPLGHWGLCIFGVRPDMEDPRYPPRRGALLPDLLPLRWPVRSPTCASFIH